MSRKRKTQIGGQFAPRLIEMLRSPAYRALSLSAHRVLARIEIELADHGGTGNGTLAVTYADFIEYGMDRHAVAAGIAQAVALGFVVITEHGRAGNAEHRTPNRYRLTYRHTDRTAPTDDWRHVAVVDKKQKAGVGFSQLPVGETHTEK